MDFRFGVSTKCYPSKWNEMATIEHKLNKVKRKKNENFMRLQIQFIHSSTLTYCDDASGYELKQIEKFRLCSTLSYFARHEHEYKYDAHSEDTTRCLWFHWERAELRMGEKHIQIHFRTSIICMLCFLILRTRHWPLLSSAEFRFNSNDWVCQKM